MSVFSGMTKEQKAEYCKKPQNTNTFPCKALKLTCGPTYMNCSSGPANPVDTLAGNVSQAVTDVADNVKYLPLVVFKPMMVAILKKKGESVDMSSSMSRIAPLFYDRVILKKNKISYESYESLDPVSITALVSAILSFIKGLETSKESGKSLNAEEQEILDMSKNIANDVKATTTTKSNWFSENKFLIIGVIALIIFFIVKKK